MTREEFDRHPWRKGMYVRAVDGYEYEVVGIDFEAFVVECQIDKRNTCWYDCEDVELIEDEKTK